MTGNRKTIEQDLLALAALSDDEIDTSEIPERLDFRNAVRGRFFDLAHRNYDVRAIGNWCIARARAERIRTSSMWLNKVVFFIYEQSLKTNRVLLTPALAEAWDHGPVFREIFSQTDRDTEVDFLTRFNVRSRTREIAFEDFLDTDLRLFESVWAKFGHLSASEVRRISHLKDAPWHKVWYETNTSNPGKVIDIVTIIGHIGLNYGRET
jgi:uncharacterized phage-associated protein